MFEAICHGVGVIVLSVIGCIILFDIIIQSADALIEGVNTLKYKYRKCKKKEEKNDQSDY